MPARTLEQLRGDLQRLRGRMREVQRTGQGFDRMGEPRLAEANYEEWRRLGRRLVSLDKRIGAMEHDLKRERAAEKENREIGT